MNRIVVRIAPTHRVRVPGCCSCVLTTLLILIGVALVLGVGLFVGVRSAHATTSLSPAAVLIAPAVPAAPMAHEARGVFFQRTLTVTVTATQVWLASSPDGSRPLCTDDHVMLTFTRANGTTERWTHLFASPNRQMITCLPPVDLSDLLHPGTYQVEVILEDHYPPTYSSRPLYLVFGHKEATQPIGLASSAVAQTPDEHPAATAETARTTNVPIRTPTVPAPPTRVAAAEPSRSPPPATLPPGAGPGVDAPRVPPAIIVGLIGMGICSTLALLGLLVLRRRSRPLRPWLYGIVDLTDSATGAVATDLLQRYPTGVAIVRRPLGVVPWSSATQGEHTGEILAQIVASAQGPVLRDLHVKLAADDGCILQPEQSYPLADGAVVLRYRQ